MGISYFQQEIPFNSLNVALTKNWQSKIIDHVDIYVAGLAHKQIFSALCMVSCYNCTLIVQL